MSQTAIIRLLQGIQGPAGPKGDQGSIEISVNQPSHGFTTGQAVYFNGTVWALAKADSSTTLGIGIVQFIDVNNFLVFSSGNITGLSGITPGAYYYVSTATPGALTTIEPGVISNFSNPILFGLSISSGLVLPFRPSFAGITGISAQRPEVLDAGRGTEASPFTNSTDNSAGIQTAVNTVSSQRSNGAVILAGSRYDTTSVVRISTPSIVLASVARGWNVDPNGESEGITASKLRAAADGVAIGVAGTKLGGVHLRDLYLWSTQNKGGGFHGILCDQNLDLPVFTNLLISNWNYGIYNSGIIDSGEFTGCSFLNNGYGVYSTTTSNIGYGFFKGCVVFDNDNAGFWLERNVSDSNAKWLNIVGNNFGRNARVLTTNGCNIYLSYPESVFVGNVVRDAGHNFITNGFVAADGIILVQPNECIVGNVFTDQTTGFAIRVRSNNCLITGNQFVRNSGGDIIVEAGATGNVIIQPNLTSFTDNGTGTAAILGDGNGGIAILKYLRIGLTATKGDVLASDASGLKKLPVGVDGQVLTADSTQTLGVKWATPSSGNVTSVTASAPLASSGGTTPNITITDFVGDSGSGGARGTVPAPAAGDNAAGKFLKASGGWAVPPSANALVSQPLTDGNSNFIFANGDVVVVVGPYTP